MTSITIVIFCRYKYPLHSEISTEPPDDANALPSDSIEVVLLFNLYRGCCHFIYEKI